MTPHHPDDAVAPDYGRSGSRALLDPKRSLGSVIIGASGAEDAARVAEKLLEALRQPFTVRDRELHATASIGISLLPGDAPDIATLERQRILEALEQCAGNQTRAAKLLGISRRTLVTRLGQYGVPRPRRR